MCIKPQIDEDVEVWVLWGIYFPKWVVQSKAKLYLKHGRIDTSCTVSILVVSYNKLRYIGTTGNVYVSTQNAEVCQYVQYHMDSTYMCICTVISQYKHIAKQYVLLAL